MTLEDLLKSVSSTYERKARLYPALLALTPILGVAAGLYGVRLKIPQAVGALFVAIGGFYLLASMVRELGKRQEDSLYFQWGGKPTTQIQRHRDRRVDKVTKAARHVFLAFKLNVPFPSVADEQTDPDAADEKYSAGTRWLLEQTRDTKKFNLLFSENIEYGYRRNALGLKPIAIPICVCSILWVLIAEHVIGQGGVDKDGLFGLPMGAIVSIALSVALLMVWTLFFTKETVRRAAFTYAETLLQACWTLRV
jgi:hypothetical protein